MVLTLVVNRHPQRPSSLLAYANISEPVIVVPGFLTGLFFGGLIAPVSLALLVCSFLPRLLFFLPLLKKRAFRFGQTIVHPEIRPDFQVHVNDPVVRTTMNI